MIKVENFEGKLNQFVIYTDNEIIFQSYNTIIVKKVNGKNFIVDTNAENYSVTTSKYLYRFLSAFGARVTKRKHLLEDIKNGKIIRENLN